MASALEYSSFELMAAAGARELKDGEIVAVGLGLPVVACFLAKRTHAPNISIILELGVIDPEPLEIGAGLSDPRFWYRAKALTSFVDCLGMTLHRGLVDVGFLGGLEVDAYGNLNTTLLGDPEGEFRRFTGSGGGNDVASSAHRTVIIIRHEARKLNEAISFITWSSSSPVTPMGSIWSSVARSCASRSSASWSKAAERRSRSPWSIPATPVA